MPEYLESDVKELVQQKEEIKIHVKLSMGFQGVPKRAQDKIIQAIEQVENPKLK